LGGTGGFVYPYASTASNNDLDPKVAKEVVTSLVQQGFQAIKMRVSSTNLQKITDYLAAARQAGGEKCQLMVDANQGWPVDIVQETPKWSVEFALSVAKELEKLNYFWLEEPINKGNFDGLAFLRKNSKVLIAGGELNST